MGCDQRQTGSYKQEMETHKAGIKPVTNCVASDLSDEGILQNPEPFVMEMNTHTWPKRQRFKEDLAECRTFAAPSVASCQ